MRPLHAQELAEVLAVDFSAPGTPLVEKLRWEDKERAVLSACSSLIAIVQDKYFGSRHVQFSHFSVKEFLTSERLATSMVDTLRYHHIHLESAHTIMAQACLSVLLRIDSSMKKRTIEGYPLAPYAGQHFGDHVEFENVLPHVAEGVDSLLDPDKPHFDVWIWLRINDWDPFVWHNSWMDEQPQANTRPWGPTHLFPKYPPRVSPLYYVAAFGHFSLTRRLISKRPQYLYATDDKCCTPLHIAVLAGQVEVSQLLIEHSINLDIRDTEDWTLLHMAAYRGLFEISQILLERHGAIEACLNMRNKKGRTALHLASRNHHSDIVELLLKLGAHVQAQDYHNMTPLHLAIQGPATWFLVDDERSSSITQLLIAHGASVHVWDKNNRTPLHLASLSEVPNTMAILLKFGADVDSRDDDNMTPLHLSLNRPYVYEEEDRIISGPQLLLEHGADVHAQNKTGQTALHLASQSYITRIVPLLLKLGADVDAKDNDNMTPLHFALTRAWTSYYSQDFVRQITVAQVLLEHGASAHTRNKDGRTPLHLASRLRFSGIVELLLKLGAEVDVRDNDNTTPLLLVPKREIFYFPHRLHDYDAKCGETARLLLVHGANVNVRDKNGQTPLHLASERHLSTFLALLLKFGADVNAQDDDNMTPLHVALFSSPELQRDGSEVSDDDSQAESDDIKFEVIQLLLEHGANIHMQNKKGETPFQVAAARGKQKVIQVLSEYMQNDHSI